MTKIRVATLAVALVAGLSTMAVAQGGNGGGGGGGRNTRGGRGSTAYTSLFTNIHLSQVEQKQVDSVGRKYDSVATAITTAWNQANGGGAAPGGGGARGGRGAFTPPPDSIQARIDSVRTFRNTELRKLLDSGQQKDFDAAVKQQASAAAALRGGGSGGGGGQD